MRRHHLAAFSSSRLESCSPPSLVAGPGLGSVRAVRPGRRLRPGPRIRRSADRPDDRGRPGHRPHRRRRRSFGRCLADAGDGRLHPARSVRRPARLRAHDGLGGLRPRQSLRRRAPRRFRAGPDRRPARPPRRRSGVGLVRSRHRSLSRPPERLFLRRQSVRLHPGRDDLQRRGDRRDLGRRLAERRADRRRRLDGRDPHPLRPDPVQAAGRLRLGHQLPEGRQAQERGEPLRLGAQGGERPGLALRRAHRARRHRRRPPPRGLALRPGPGRVPARRAGQSLPDRERLRRERRLRSHGRPEQQPDPQSLGQSRFRPGRGRSGRHQRHRPGDLLRGEAALLHRGLEHLRFRPGRAERHPLDRLGESRFLLQPAHRPGAPGIPRRLDVRRRPRLDHHPFGGQGDGQDRPRFQPRRHQRPDRAGSTRPSISTA